jgi:hypothetical protein
MLWASEQTIYALIAQLRGGSPLPPTYDIREMHWPDVSSEIITGAPAEICIAMDIPLCLMVA